MDKKISYIKERVLQIAKNKGVSYEEFCKSIGMTYGNFKGKQKMTSLNSETLERILSMYDDINPEWLLTGKGEMLRELCSELGSETSNVLIDLELKYIEHARKVMSEELKKQLSSLKKEMKVIRTQNELIIDMMDEKEVEQMIKERKEKIKNLQKLQSS